MATAFFNSTSFTSKRSSMCFSPFSSSGGGGGRINAMRAGSVYRGAGGSGVHTSKASAGSGSGCGFGGGFSATGGAGGRFSGGFSGAAAGGGFSFSGGADDSIIGNEKFTMQNLNGRLAAYLEKVRSLEKANEDLELKIRQFLDNKISPTGSVHDYSTYEVTIGDLRAKILSTMQENNTVQLSIDNTSLTAVDFRMKYENELAMRQSVEADIARLKNMLNEFIMSHKVLNLEIEGLNEELVYMKKNHEESKTLKPEVATSTETLQSLKTELNTVKSKERSLQTDLQSLLAAKSYMEVTLSETQNRYALQLSGYQAQVSGMEGQLVQLRADLVCQSQEYQMLLDIKTRLEKEIAEYGRLLEGEDSGSLTISCSSSSSSSITTTNTAAITIVKEVVDGGKVVSSSTSLVK